MACSPPAKRRPTHGPTTAGSGALLPPDMLFDVLLRLPARDLCRLRTVCRPWRALLTADPVFADAHAARHRAPLLLARFRSSDDEDDDARVHVVDISSPGGAAAVVTRVVVATADGYHQHHHHRRLLRTRLDVGCVATETNGCHVIDPATGASHVLYSSSL